MRQRTNLKLIRWEGYVSSKKLVLATFVASCLIPLATHASDSDGHWLMYGIGSKSCGTFLQAEDNFKSSADEAALADRYAFMSWAEGYLSYYNHYANDLYDIAGATDPSGIERWLYNYCQQNPLAAFPNAIDALVIELYPNRIKHAPRDSR